MEEEIGTKAHYKPLAFDEEEREERGGREEEQPLDEESHGAAGEASSSSSSSLSPTTSSGGSGNVGSTGRNSRAGVALRFTPNQLVVEDATHFFVRSLSPLLPKQDLLPPRCCYLLGFQL